MHTNTEHSDYNGSFYNPSVISTWPSKLEMIRSNLKGVNQLNDLYQDATAKLELLNDSTIVIAFTGNIKCEK